MESSLKKNTSLSILSTYFIIVNNYRINYTLCHSVLDDCHFLPKIEQKTIWLSRLYGRSLSHSKKKNSSVHIKECLKDNIPLLD